MVWIFKPPGASSTRANRPRARFSTVSSGSAPVTVAMSRASSIASPGTDQRPSRSTMRLAISAAAALVKVRQSSFCGAVPSSSSDNTRSVSTLVLPVPAEASTQTLTAGSAARCWLRVASESSALVALLHRPFLDTREMSVVVEAEAARGMRLRLIDGRRIVEGGDETLETGFSRLDAQLRIGDRLHLARRIAARQAPMLETRDLLGLESRKGAVLRHHRLERQLSREPGFDVRGGGQAAGLVIDQHQPAIPPALDAVGLADELEVAGRAHELHLALGFVVKRLHNRSPPSLLGHHPARDTLEARPPEGPDGGLAEHRSEGFAAEFEQLLIGIGGNGIGESAHEA